MKQEPKQPTKKDISQTKKAPNLNRPQSVHTKPTDKPIHKAGPPITASFISTLDKLKFGGWFTDEVVNAYFAYLGQHYPKTGFISSYFAVR